MSRGRSAVVLVLVSIALSACGSAGPGMVHGTVTSETSTASTSPPAEPSSPTATVSATPSPSASASASVSPTATATPKSSQSQKPTPTGPLPSLPPGSAVPASLSGKIWTSIPTSQKVVALTFDAGANADAVPKILATLEAERVPATFFLTGDWVRHYPAQTKQIAWSGYPIGNHSDTHPHFPTLTDAERIAQVGKADATISSMIGKSTTKPLFRFPYGESAGSLETVNAAGYTPIGWTVDGAGWMGTAKISADGVYNRVMAKVQPGEIVLMHVGSNPDDRSTLDADALPRIIQQLKSMGYGFTDLRALVG